jgi:hypothetical protein
VSRALSPSALRVSAVALVVALFAVGGAVLLFANQGPPPQYRTFDLRVIGRQMTPATLQANQGDTLTVSIQADQIEDIHLHGYDRHFFAGPSPATLTFTADLTGSFALEIEATSTPLGTLEVQPRGGVLGIGRPPDQSSTTVVQNQFAGITRVDSTRSYNLTLEVGPLQPMYTQAQASAQRPKAGEVMFTGQMVMPPGMAGMESMAGMTAPPGWHHLEVHVFDRTSGYPVRGLAPVITVINVGSGQALTVPIVTMQGLNEGARDFHYGNNVELPAGRYRVTATAGGQTGAFDITV